MRVSGSGFRVSGFVLQYHLYVHCNSDHLYVQRVNFGNASTLGSAGLGTRLVSLTRIAIGGSAPSAGSADAPAEVIATFVSLNSSSENNREEEQVFIPAVGIFVLLYYSRA